MFLTRQVSKTRINYAKKKIEIWFIVPEEGPMHELTEWFTNNPINLELHELDSGLGTKAINRALRFIQCKIIDNEIVYDYSTNDHLRNYTVWSYEETNSD